MRKTGLADIGYAATGAALVFAGAVLAVFAVGALAGVGIASARFVLKLLS